MQQIGIDTDEPIVGKYYLVKCAVIANGYDKKIYMPIIGDPHKDKQFGVKYEHVHIDGRFFNNTNYKYSVDRQGKTNGVIPVDYFSNKIIGYEYKVRRCIRTTTGILPPANNKIFLNCTKLM